MISKQVEHLSSRWPGPPTNSPSRVQTYPLHARPTPITPFRQALGAGSRAGHESTHDLKAFQSDLRLAFDASMQACHALRKPFPSHAKVKSSRHAPLSAHFLVYRPVSSAFVLRITNLSCNRMSLPDGSSFCVLSTWQYWQRLR